MSEVDVNCRNCNAKYRVGADARYCPYCGSINRASILTKENRTKEVEDSAKKGFDTLFEVGGDSRS